MSKRKDREKFQRIKTLYPAYKGYRGPTEKPTPRPELKSISCSVCGMRRNVSPDTPEEGFVCLSCQEENQTSASLG